jgi:hypothetical protein
MDLVDIHMKMEMFFKVNFYKVKHKEWVSITLIMDDWRESG